MSNSKQYKSNSSNLLRVRTLTAAYTPIQADSGTYFVVDADGQAITLGAPSSFEIGTWFRFTVGATLTGSWVITSAGATDFHGRVQGGGTNDAAAGTSGGTGENTVTLVTTAAEEGDFVEILGDGTNWYIWGHCELAANITVTAV